MNENLPLNVTGHFHKLNQKYNGELQQTVSFAAKLCNASIASINLIDADFQWKHFRKGVTDQPPQYISILTYEVKQNRLLVVSDTLLHPVFCNHPSVAGEFKIRFYATTPLINYDGHRIGTLTVIDSKPHQLSNQEKLIFKLLAKHVVSVVELRSSIDLLDKNFTQLKAEQAYRLKSETRLRSTFESLTDAYFLLGLDGEILDFNRIAYRTVREKFCEKLTAGRLMKDFLLPNYQQQFTNYFEGALRGEKMQIERLADYGERGKVWWDCVFEPVRNDGGFIIGVSYVVRNINERKLNEAKIIEQNRLLSRVAEIQSHDYRSPVASILGLMNLIEADDYQAPREYLIMLQDAVKRLDEKIHEVVDMVNYPIEEKVL